MKNKWEWELRRHQILDTFITGSHSAWQRVKEERNILQKTERRKAKWISHILRRNCLLKLVIEGKIEEKIEVTGRRGRRRKKLLDYLQVKEQILEIERQNTRSYSVKSSLYKKQWTLHKTDYRMNEGYTKLYYQKFLHNILFPEYVQAWIKFVSLFQKTCSVNLDSCILLQECFILKIRTRNPSSCNKTLHYHTTQHYK